MKALDRMAMRGGDDVLGTDNPADVASPARSQRGHVTRSSFRDFDPPAALRVVRLMGATSKRVFDAWLDPEIAGRWLFATASQPVERIAIDARVGGWFRCVEGRSHEVVEHIGEYVEITPDRRLVFTLSVEKRPHVITRVCVDISPRDAQCELTLVQVNVPRSCVDYVESRWTGMLFGLDDMLHQ